jgi:hypothetical protein
LAAYGSAPCHPVLINGSSEALTPCVRCDQGTGRPRLPPRAYVETRGFNSALPSSAVARPLVLIRFTFFGRKSIKTTPRPGPGQRFSSSRAPIVTLFCIFAFGVQPWALGLKNSRKTAFYYVPLQRSQGHDMRGRGCGRRSLPRSCTTPPPRRRLQIPEKISLIGLLSTELLMSALLRPPRRESWDFN